MRHLTCILLLLISLSCRLTAQERTDSVRNGEGGDLIVSVVTCEPGPDVYELCGHAALRIRNEVMDSVWNYGIFDFTSPNFIYRFCKGETDYMVYGYQFERFMPAYVRRGSKVTEQVLDLTQEEAQKLKSMLETESRPENRVYRYNYVRDNCATRPWKRVTQATYRSISLPDTLYFSTFREEMRHFHRNYPWYQFGIDLVLGSGLDYQLDRDEDIFAPPVLEAKLAKADINGKPLVKSTNVIFQGDGDVTLPPTPWYMTPMAVGILMLLLSFGTLFVYVFKGNIWKWWISLYFLTAGVAGCIVTFLVFLSEHEATSPNLLIFWLNPFQFVLAIGVLFRSWKWPVRVLAIYDLLVVLVFLFVWGTPLISQKANPAMWPMMLCMLPLCIVLLSKTGLFRIERVKKYKK